MKQPEEEYNPEEHGKPTSPQVFAWILVVLFGIAMIVVIVWNSDVDGSPATTQSLDRRVSALEAIHAKACVDAVEFDQDVAHFIRQHRALEHDPGSIATAEERKAWNLKQSRK